MSAIGRKEVTLNFAGSAVELAALMVDVPPILFLHEVGMGERDTVKSMILSNIPSRVAVLSLTFCNPLALRAAATLEGRN